MWDPANAQKYLSAPSNGSRMEYYIGRNQKKKFNQKFNVKIGKHTNFQKLGLDMTTSKFSEIKPFMVSYTLLLYLFL